MDENDKLEWMYKKSSVNNEEYLLGKKIDKNFEETDNNIVDKEILPTRLTYFSKCTDTEQVDLVRKRVEDPLTLIKQKEIEARRKILENPLKLKKIHEILKKDKVGI
jgi:hypothetical protein